MLSHDHTNFLAESKDGLPAQAGVFPIYKKAGETLAVLVARFKSEQSLDQSVPVTYAGRLDPMADGLVLLLTGKKCKEKDSFLGLDKTYTFEVLFGVATDTFDMLGLITDSKESFPTEQEIREALLGIKDKTIFSYPPFSSKPVKGQPLFMHARAGTLPEELPTIQGEIKEISLKSLRTVSFKKVIEASIEIIEKVEGDFRQKEIIDGWQDFLEKIGDGECAIAICEVTVSSGVYVRSIATMIGEALGAPVLAYSINRTRVGHFIL